MIFSRPTGASTALARWAGAPTLSASMMFRGKINQAACSRPLGLRIARRAVRAQALFRGWLLFQEG
jgi:hypothetical protein